MKKRKKARVVKTWPWHPSQDLANTAGVIVRYFVAALISIAAVAFIASSHGCISPEVAKHQDCTEWHNEGEQVSCRTCREFTECRKPLQKRQDWPGNGR